MLVFYKTVILQAAKIQPCVNAVGKSQSRFYNQRQNQPQRLGFELL